MSDTPQRFRIKTVTTNVQNERLAYCEYERATSVTLYNNAPANLIVDGAFPVTSGGTYSVVAPQLGVGIGELEGRFELRNDDGSPVNVVVVKQFVA